MGGQSLAVDRAGIQTFQGFFQASMSSVSHALQHELPRHSQYSGKSAGAAKLEERGRAVAA